LIVVDVDEKNPITRLAMEGSKLVARLGGRLSREYVSGWLRVYKDAWQCQVKNGADLFAQSPFRADCL